MAAVFGFPATTSQSKAKGMSTRNCSVYVLLLEVKACLETCQFFLVCRFECHGLNAGDKCVFKVKAVNAAGYSQSTAESEVCIVQAAIGEY